MTAYCGNEVRILRGTKQPRESTQGSRLLPEQFPDPCLKWGIRDESACVGFDFGGACKQDVRGQSPVFVLGCLSSVARVCAN